MHAVITTAQHLQAGLDEVRASPNDDGTVELIARRPAVGERETLGEAELDVERWALAGDQLYVDFDLSAENLPPGTRVQIGSAVVEVSDLPHLGCGKFTERYGAEARELVNSPEGVALNLRGINTQVVQSGTVRRGDAVRKLSR